MFTTCGYQCSVGQSGTTTIASALSLLIFAIIWTMRLVGKCKSSDHAKSLSRAVIFLASGSVYHETSINLFMEQKYQYLVCQIILLKSFFKSFKILNCSSVTVSFFAGMWAADFQNLFLIANSHIMMTILFLSYQFHSTHVVM